MTVSRAVGSAQQVDGTYCPGLLTPPAVLYKQEPCQLQRSRLPSKLKTSLVSPWESPWSWSSTI